MSDLQKAFFERDLSAAEEDALLEQLEASDQAANDFAALAAADYKASGFPAPVGGQPRRWGRLAAGALLALGLAWVLWPKAKGPQVIHATIDERAFSEEEVAPPRRPQPTLAAEEESLPEPDRLDVTRDAQGFVLAVQVMEAGAGKLVLQDLQGKTLRSLFSGSLEEGRWDFRWDGSGQDGNALKPGQYRLAWVRGGQTVRKVVQVEAR